MAPLGRISWMGQVDAVLASVSDMLYSWGLMWLLIGAGIFFTVRTRGVQVRHTDAIAASVIGSRDGSHGGITSFQAFAVGLACRVGTGNIVGVALALILGGPGAVLWMWLVAILGTATAFSEATLAQLFKVRRPDGTFRGGSSDPVSGRGGQSFLRRRRCLMRDRGGGCRCMGDDISWRDSGCSL